MILRMRRLHKRTLVNIGLIVVMVLGMFSVIPTPQAQAQVDKTFSQPEDLGTAVTSVAALDSAYGVEDGKNVLYTTVSGTPGVFQVIDLETYQLLRTYPLEGVHGSWSHVIDQQGRVYIAGTGKLFRYDPATKTVKDFGYVVSGAREVYGLSVDEAGNVYGGTYPGSHLFRFDPVTEQFTDYGSVVPGQDYVRSLAYHDGYAYAGIGTVGSVVRVNVETGEKETIPIPDRPEYYDVNQLGSVFSVNIVRDYLFVMISGANVMLVYDIQNNVWLPDTITNYRGLYTSPEYEGKTYFVANSKLQSFDLDTHEVTETGIAFGTYLRHSGWVEGGPNGELPGMNLVTIQFGGQVTFFNIATQQLKTYLPVVEGQPTPIQTLEKGPDGKLYLSGYMGTFGAQFDPATGENVRFNL